MTKQRKGIILAGGAGTRLYPATRVVSKLLLPVYDKPMIYYPLATLMLADIRQILVITTPQSGQLFKELLADGSDWGLELEYAYQPTPLGVAHAMIIADDYLAGAPSALILGDNIFYGEFLQNKLRRANERASAGATIFTFPSPDPRQYGVAEFNQKQEVIGLEEKPLNPKSDYAVTGLYFYDSLAPEYARQLSPSQRGELEITDLNKIYLAKHQLEAEKLGSEDIWIDAGTHESLVNAHQQVKDKEDLIGSKFACPEVIALNRGWISVDHFEQLANTANSSSYGKYLKKCRNKSP